MTEKIPYQLILMLGKPGSGKGTQADLISKRFGYPLFSTGAAMRAMKREDTIAGHKVVDTIDKGNLAPWWFAAYFFKHELFSMKEGGGRVFEGTVRTEPEAALFHEVAHWLSLSYIGIELVVPEDKLLARILKRADIENRADDTEETFKNRLAVFERDSRPAIESLQSLGSVQAVDGNRSVEDIHQDIVGILTQQA